MEQKLRFTVDSALLKELGEKLVETVHVALTELVKNAYDADASEVEVIFDQNEDGTDRIRIVDNGSGMNFNAVERYWMRIATDNKSHKNNSTIYGRPLTGAKGIGRFSCRRLGTRLRLITKGTEAGNLVGKQKNVQETIVTFPWEDFEAGTDVTTIECPGSQRILSEAITGTVLVIENINLDEWGTRGINWLKRQLAVLSANQGARREGYEDDPGFLVFLTANDFEGGIRDLRDDLLNAGWGTLNAHINSKGQAVCELNALGLGRKTVTSSREFKHLEDVKLKIAIMVDDREQMRDTSVLSKTNLQEILNYWGGVQIRFRGFRVFPYGDDDWLSIDKDRGIRKGTPKDELLVFAESLRGVDASRSLLNMLSMKSYVGNVEIGSNETGFEMKANREGFLESAALKELREFVRFSVDWSTILRDFYLRQQVFKRAQFAREEFEHSTNIQVNEANVVDRALEFISNEISVITRDLDEESRIKIEDDFVKASEVIKRQNESNREQLAHLRLVASTSTLLLIFSHEVKSLMGLLEQTKNSLLILGEGLPNQARSKVQEISEEFSDLNDRLGELLELTSLVSRDKTKSVPDRVAVRPKVIKVEKVFDLIVNKYEISIDSTEVQKNVVIKKIFESELYSILLNIVSNSIKAVIAKGGDKKIKIEAKYENSQAIITVLDNGIGLSEDKFKDVLTPFVSDPEGILYPNLNSRINPEDISIVGTGSGLGLGIVQEIVLAHGGSVSFVSPRENWASEIRVILT